ncbi:hypothetical protein EDC01DRAFT_482643 [Geopyxis carbonaria]|nr:hypothetical protein EDC01DRAFT_482643 [Geopyxis carbonaria]
MTSAALLSAFVARLGDEVDDVYEESFSLSLTKPPSKNLGFLSRSSSTLDIDLSPTLTVSISQSPSLLTSTLPGGTTGAVVWSITPRFARWLLSPTCTLFTSSLLTPTSSILELGAGVSSVLALAAAARGVRRYVLTDQAYVLKLARANVDANAGALAPKQRRKGRGGGGAGGGAGGGVGVDVIETVELDWEATDVATHPALSGRGALTAVFACDCIYNEALVQPFVECCADACRLNSSDGGNGDGGDAGLTFVVVAQELRSADVFECFLEEFTRVFRTWRVPAHMLSEELRPDMGFAVHFGVLREQWSPSE